jgi:sugar lactone lactonase YvrE
MKRFVRRLLLTLVAIIALLAAAIWTRYGGRTLPFPDRSTPPLIVNPQIEVVAQLDGPPGNLAVAPNGRIFFSFHPEGRPPVKVAEWKDGHAAAWPSADYPLFDCPLSLRIDRQGRLWSIDNGFHGLRQPRLLAFDIASGKLVHQWDIPRSIAGLGSFVQDMQIDPEGRYVYIADIGLAAKKPAIIVYDSTTRNAHRVLENHWSTEARPFKIMVNGHALSLLGGLYPFHPALDSIALDDAGEWLYYGPMSHETLYRVRTSELKDASIKSPNVEAYGPKPQTDGIAIDHAGNLYLSDVEHGALSILTPDKQLHTLVRDPRFRWLDGFSFGPDGWLYATDSDLPDIMLKTRSQIATHAPFYIWRIKTKEAAGAASR